MEKELLIKALRYCAGHEGCDYYIAKDCPRESTWVCGADCEQILMLDAADALEAAEKRIAEIEAQLPKQPTVDAVPVVRCGRCEYYSNEMNCCSYVNGLQNVTKTDYCSYGRCADGERRTDADGKSTRD